MTRRGSGNVDVVASDLLRSLRPLLLRLDPVSAIQTLLRHHRLVVTDVIVVVVSLHLATAGPSPTILQNQNQILRRESLGLHPDKDLGQGDVSSRLNKTALQRAILEEKAKSDPVLAAKLAAEKQQRYEALPDWVKDAEAINAKVKGKGGNEASGVEVTEEQLEAYRLVNREEGGWG